MLLWHSDCLIKLSGILYRFGSRLGYLLIDRMCRGGPSWRPSNSTDDASDAIFRIEDLILEMQASQVNLSCLLARLLTKSRLQAGDLKIKINFAKTSSYSKKTS